MKYAATRKDAKRLGMKFYFTGKPCPKGHIGYRYTSKGRCFECEKAFLKSDHKKEYDRVRYEANKEKRKAEASDWYYKNKEKAAEAVATWKSANPDKVKAIRQNYKARRRQWESDGVTSKELGEWLKEQKKVCYWCGAKCAKDYHIDHYVALARGGSHSINNMVISCPTCNMRKKAKDPYEWAKEVGRLF